MLVILSSHETRALVDLCIGYVGGMFPNSSAPAVVSRATDIKSLRAAQEAAIEAFVSKNADHMVSAYSADASLMFPNSPILQDEGLRTAIRALAADPNFSMRFSTDKVEVARSGEVGTPVERTQ
jgi:ketosteroid isomerase-like protein